MAVRSPAQVQVKTASTGFGPYTLVNTTPEATGYRSFAHALADGSIANGDTLHYLIFQNNAPNTKMIERGWGTINTSTMVLSPTILVERSAGLTSGGGWGAGDKDVLIGPPGAESVALLEFANRFVQNQTIAKANPAVLFEVGSVIRANVNQSNIDLWMQYFNASSVLRAQLLVGETNIWQYYTAAGVLKGQLTIGDDTITFSNGTTTSALARVTTGSRVVQFPTGGTVKMTFNCAPPTNWTRINVTGQRYSRFAEAADTPEAQGGSWPITGISASDVSLSISQLPSHNHGIGSTAFVGAGSATQVLTPDAGFFQTTSSTGSGDPHSHTVVSDGTWRPVYEIVVKASHN